ncbi:hypothetical protein [Microbulbifer agarilyticus]|uniref:hypothetical protein n=1 Tax=Microbulbifer agarilyticus TaxID=260552 RepID=UPI001CD1AA67|nr:hypothetical protein [Microbulbifer agarilyticus]MCA0893856.1 hypothetical protein [Microbulbifer agarilyticus]
MTDSKGIQRSRYCQRHNTHNKRHGHPTRKQPSLKTDANIRVSFLAGQRWAKRNNISKLVDWFAQQYREAAKYTFSEHRHKREYSREELWAFHLQHLQKHFVHPQDLAIRLVGLSWACASNPERFHGEDFTHIFFVKRLLALKPLPRHNKDAYSGKSQPYGQLSLSFARWIGQRLETVGAQSITGHFEVLVETERQSLKQSVSNKTAQRQLAAEASARARARHAKKEESTRRLMWDMNTGQYFWVYDNGKVVPK